MDLSGRIFFFFLLWLSQICTIHFSQYPCWCEYDCITESLNLWICVYRREYACFQINRCTSGAISLEIWACTCSGYHIWGLSRKSNLRDQLTVKSSCWKSFIMVMRKWYHFGTGTMFFYQTLYLVCPLSFKHVRNQKPLFDWTKIKLYFFISDIREKVVFN